MKIIAPLEEHVIKALLEEAGQDDFFVFLETTRITAEERHSYLFGKPEKKIVFHCGDAPGEFFATAEKYLAAGYYLAGWFSYEFGYLLEPALAPSFEDRQLSRPLAEFGVFQKPYVFDHLTNTFADTAWPLSPASAPDEGRLKVSSLRASQSREEYIENIATIKKYIEAGETYQVNYTLKLLFNYQGETADFYNLLRRSQRVGYGAFIKTGEHSILSYSPELFFRKIGEKCMVRPMKGTVRRGRNLEEDRAIARFLQNDMKNRSENVMIVDLLRNDLGRLCEMGTVEVTSLFDVAAFETLQQMTSTIEGKLRKDVGLHELFRAIYPCGSVTGAPKIRTMEIIRELESADRGVYTGGIGFLTPDGNGCFSVPIRTLVLENGKGEMGIGSGIVYDSDAEDEWNECMLKSNFLTLKAPGIKLIETMLWQMSGGFWLLDLHLDRLARSAEHFRYPLDIEKIHKALDELAMQLSSRQGAAFRVRLLVDQQGQFDLSSEECPVLENDVLEIFSINPPKVLPKIKLSAQQTDSQSLFFYHKTTNRQLYNDERNMAVREGYYEVIFTNDRGEVTEGSITNVFVRFGNTIKTPPLSCGLLDGVLRRYLAERFSGISPSGQQEICELKFCEATLLVDDLKKADRIYVGNSVRGLVEVQL